MNICTKLFFSDDSIFRLITLMSSLIRPYSDMFGLFLIYYGVSSCLQRPITYVALQQVNHSLLRVMLSIEVKTKP